MKSLPMDGSRGQADAWADMRREIVKLRDELPCYYKWSGQKVGAPDCATRFSGGIDSQYACPRCRRQRA